MILPKSKIRSRKGEVSIGTRTQKACKDDAGYQGKRYTGQVGCVEQGDLPYPQITPKPDRGMMDLVDQAIIILHAIRPGV
jgi:hypothetical protein